MQLNFDDGTYRRLCLLADYYGTTPAWLARQWLETKLAIEEEFIRLRHRPGGEGSQGGVGASTPSTTLTPHSTGAPDRDAQA